jgi:predicted metal-dependent hydrolase
MNINLELEEIILLLNENKFVEAHDIFEELWRVYKKDEVTRKESFILKAFVNASVHIELYKMERLEHSLNVWNTYKKYEYLIDELDSLNKNNYQRIKEIIYEKREQYIK